MKVTKVRPESLDQMESQENLVRKEVTDFPGFLEQRVSYFVIT